MSIINEALKKTQARFRERTKVATSNRLAHQMVTMEQPVIAPQPLPELTQEIFPATTREKTKKWHVIVLVEIVILLITAGIIFIWQPRLFHTANPEIANPLSLAETKPISPAQGTTPTSDRSQAHPTVDLSVTNQVSPSIALTPLTESKKSTQPTDLVLNGIMTQQGKMIALINNKIYELGDEVNGKKITKITLDRIELRDSVGLTIVDIQQKSTSR